MVVSLQKDDAYDPYEVNDSAANVKAPHAEGER
jgi:hypothetical protein